MDKKHLEIMKSVYDMARTVEPGDYGGISEVKYATDYGSSPAPWRIGPFRELPEMAFKKERLFDDPTGIGWRSDFIFNPSLICKDGLLHLFYRAAPQKESLSSRIGHAVYDPQTGWEDLSGPPAVWPTENDETHGTEDPKVYFAEGKYFMFYQADWQPDEEERRTLLGGAPKTWELCTVTKCAVSEDLISWKKLGQTVPYEISRGWSKGAVIPRNPAGEAVKIGGEYLMFVSEGCGEQQHVGRSPDMVSWTFEPITYLTLPPEIGRILEVSCLTTGHKPNGEMVMDFFYLTPDGRFEAMQALYNTSDPFVQLDMQSGGALAWGGMLAWNGKWLVAQGWDAPKGKQEMYFYEAEL